MNFGVAGREAKRNAARPLFRRLQDSDGHLSSDAGELNVCDLPHGLAECGQSDSVLLYQLALSRERGINLTHQHVRAI
jgi:hypothetical protein